MRVSAGVRESLTWTRVARLGGGDTHPGVDPALPEVRQDLVGEELDVGGVRHTGKPQLDHVET